MMVFCPHCGRAWEPESENTASEAKCPSCFASFLAPPASDRPATTATLPTAKIPTAPTVRDRTTEEQSIYADGSVSITTARAMIHGTTYALRNITSVRMAVTHPNTHCATALMTVSILVGIGSLGVLYFSWIAGLVFLFLATIGWLSARAWFRTYRADYRIIIVSSSGETEALTSKDESRVQKIVESINCAIALYH